MSVIQAIAVVMAVVQFIKKPFPLIVEGMVAKVLVILASVAVTLYKFISEGLPLSFAAITFAVEVIIGALSAYSLIKVAGGNGA